MNSALAQTLLLHLAQLGVREVCVAAGARNVPLISALLASQGLHLWNFFEERCAGFFALGRMMAQRSPVAVVTTSGTAAAELLPAVIEAYYQGQPLIVITADRPSRYRGSGAPQAIEQVGLFGAYAERTLDLEGHAYDVAWPKALGCKPLHINICFDEPLHCATSGVDFSAWDAALPSPGPADASMAEVLEQFLSVRDGLVVLAAGLHPDEAAKLTPALARLAVPIVAEATANLHAPELEPLKVIGGEKALAALNPKRVLRLGSVPSWRWWRDLEDRRGVHVMHLANAPFSGLARYQGVAVQPLDLLCRAVLAAASSNDGLVTAHKAGALQPLTHLLEDHPLSEPAWMRHVSQVIPASAPVFLGNSLPIREWNLAGTGRSATFANRGANGIDGLVSTFYGLGVEAAESWLVIGDLSVMYDLSAPWIAAQLPAGKRRIAIVNNGGGKIFSRVESLRSLDEKARQVVENRHAIGFEPWARLWGVPYRKVTRPEDLNDLPETDVILEILPDAAQTDAFWQAWATV